MNAGNVYLIRRDDDNVMTITNAALALDPSSQTARQFQKETITGSQMRSGWWDRGR